MATGRFQTVTVITLLLTGVSAGVGYAQDKYRVKVPGGIAFSEFRGYESWQVVSVSQGTECDGCDHRPIR